jgi:hypothetical protein
MKDRIGNVVEKGKRVLVQLPEANIFGVVAKVEEASRISTKPGRVLISCVIALPVSADFNQVAQCVVVEDPDKAAPAMSIVPPADAVMGPN